HRTCGCRKWDMTAMPCNHAVSAIVKAKLQPEDFVDDFFKKAMYKKSIWPYHISCPWSKSVAKDKNSGHRASSFQRQSWEATNKEEEKPI
uniref:SWIM-type domain-containing protein n=1 Tax=Aegilops tauschii subsp. strangulata TaxID=200361 RepID=A0A453DV90_AEGTS